MSEQGEVDQYPKVRGYCPMGCGDTLFLGAGGYVTCSYINCPRPDAVADIIAECETEHIVTVYRDTWSAKHPLRERLNNELLTCGIGDDLQSRKGPPRRPGTYRVVRDGNGWSWSERFGA